MNPGLANSKRNIIAKIVHSIQWINPCFVCSHGNVLTTDGFFLPTSDRKKLFHIDSSINQTFELQRIQDLRHNVMHASEKWVQSQPARDSRRGPNTWSEKSLEKDGCRAL